MSDTPTGALCVAQSTELEARMWSTLLRLWLGVFGVAGGCSSSLLVQDYFTSSNSKIIIICNFLYFLLLHSKCIGSVTGRAKLREKRDEESGPGLLLVLSSCSSPSPLSSSSFIEGVQWWRLAVVGERAIERQIERKGRRGRRGW